jgi:hypothetical protein
MGNWNINIQGVGPHHNQDNPRDADRLAAMFVEVLREAGHTVEHATFTSGSKTDLAPATRPTGDLHP